MIIDQHKKSITNYENRRRKNIKFKRKKKRKRKTRLFIFVGLHRILQTDELYNDEVSEVLLSEVEKIQK